MPDSESPTDEQSRRREAEKLFKESIGHITSSEISAAGSSGQEKVNKLQSDVPSALEAVWHELKLLIAMLRDFVTGSYREIPFGSIAAIAAAVLYFVSPIDSIPDFIPGFGYMDDAAVLALCLRMVGKDIARYEKWAAENVESK